MPANALPCRSTTRPEMMPAGLWIIGSNTRGCSPIVIQSERIGSIAGARTTTRYTDPTMRLSGVWNEPSSAVRIGPSLKRTRFGLSQLPPFDQTSTT